MDAATRRSITRLYPLVEPRIYTSCKLRSDPLYQAVVDALLPTSHPLLDIGCGMGLLAQALRASGHQNPISGLDYDQRKIAVAKAVAARHDGGAPLDFHCADALTGLPDHLGDVALLDLLQFFPPADQDRLLSLAAARVAPGATLVLRNTLEDPSRRFRLSRATDRFSKLTRWMSDAPASYPSGPQITAALHQAGLEGELRPLWGKTPFNNFFGAFRRPISPD